MTFNHIDDLIPISALQHYHFCRRQCALIHIEQQWEENLFTAEGRVMHDKVHEQFQGMRKNVIVERDVSLVCHRLGLTGKADMVEFHLTGNGCRMPFPVEYKRGKPKKDDCDRVQLCAQALCLEEMLSVRIDEGALYYGKTHHRHDVRFDEQLRTETENLVLKIRGFLDAGMTPMPEYSVKCDRCSFLAVCMPKPVESGKKVSEYIRESSLP
jgi:CRISPR-associated exonuclease Cas4